MHKGHKRGLLLFLKGHGYCRFFSHCVRRHPGMLNSTRSLELRESAVMGRSLEGPVKKSVYLRIQRELFSCIPRISGNLGIEPCIEDLTERSWDRSFKLKFKGLGRVLHYFFSFFFFLSLKYCSNWSRRSFQNRS